MSDKIARWVRLLRQMANNSRATADAHDEFADPALVEGHTQNARDLEECANFLEVVGRQQPARGQTRQSPEGNVSLLERVERSLRSGIAILFGGLA